MSSYLTECESFNKAKIRMVHAKQDFLERVGKRLSDITECPIITNEYGRCIFIPGNFDHGEFQLYSDGRISYINRLFFYELDSKTFREDTLKDFNKFSRDQIDKVLPIIRQIYDSGVFAKFVDIYDEEAKLPTNLQ